MTACGGSAPRYLIHCPTTADWQFEIAGRPVYVGPAPWRVIRRSTTPALPKCSVFAAVLYYFSNTINTIYNSISLTPVYTRPSMSWEGNVTLAVVPSCTVAYSLGLG